MVIMVHGDPDLSCHVDIHGLRQQSLTVLAVLDGRHRLEPGRNDAAGMTLMVGMLDSRGKGKNYHIIYHYQHLSTISQFRAEHEKKLCQFL